ncbi:MAG: helix-turn-helix transcriptional regulator [Blastochloris sp.]|nr:helix-turn-helix transcriptional regulator [Blastochloris sp.]
MNTALRLVDWSALQCELLWVYDRRVRADWRDRPARPQDKGLRTWLLRKGRVTIKAQGRFTHAQAPCWIIPSSLMQHQTFSLHAELLSVHIDAFWPDGERFFAPKRSLIFSPPFTPNLEKAALSLCRLIDRHFPGAETALSRSEMTFPLYCDIQLRLLRWLQALHPCLLMEGESPKLPPRLDERVLQALRWIHKVPLDQSWSTPRLAQHFGLSPSQLDRRFLQALGRTPRECFEARRCEQAHGLLVRNAMTIKEIAYSLGFRQPSHFSAWFKARTQHSPRSLRSQLSEL